MMKWIIGAAAAASGFAFAAGCYVGWKTTLKALDSVTQRVGAPVDRGR